MAKKKKTHKHKISNRRAWRDYHISEVVECGIELVGTEVKSIRASKMTLDEAYVRLKRGELVLVGATIAAYSQASDAMQHDPARDRKLLLHKRQIAALEDHVRQKGKTIIPLAVYFKRGWAKIEIALAVGKREFDKRDDLKKKQHTRDIDRAMKTRRR